MFERIIAHLKRAPDEVLGPRMIGEIVGMIRADADNRISNLQETAAQAETFEIDFIPAGSAAALDTASTFRMAAARSVRAQKCLRFHGNISAGESGRGDMAHNQR